MKEERNRGRNKCSIKEGWEGDGRQGEIIGDIITIGGLLWIPVLWDDEEDPDWHKAVGLDFNPTSPKEGER